MADPVVKPYVCFNRLNHGLMTWMIKPPLFCGNFTNSLLVTSHSNGIHRKITENSAIFVYNGEMSRCGPQSLPRRVSTAVPTRLYHWISIWDDIKWSSICCWLRMVCFWVYPKNESTSWYLDLFFQYFFRSSSSMFWHNFWFCTLSLQSWPSDKMPTAQEQTQHQWHNLWRFRCTLWFRDIVAPGTSEPPKIEAPR